MNDLIGAPSPSVENSAALPSHKLSDEAKALLAEAAKDKHGSVLVVRHMNGTNIQTNGKNMIASNERREIALWEQAVAQLVQLGLLVGRGLKGQVYEVTALGYEVVDSY